MLCSGLSARENIGDAQRPANYLAIPKISVVSQIRRSKVWFQSILLVALKKVASVEKHSSVGIEYDTMAYAKPCIIDDHREKVDVYTEI